MSAKSPGRTVLVVTDGSVEAGAFSGWFAGVWAPDSPEAPILEVRGGSSAGYLPEAELRPMVEALEAILSRADLTGGIHCITDSTWVAYNARVVLDGISGRNRVCAPLWHRFAACVRRARARNRQIAVTHSPRNSHAYQKIADREAGRCRVLAAESGEFTSVDWQARATTPTPS